jgi:glycosyltransferase involved in cell wall biosynthesis
LVDVANGLHSRGYRVSVLTYQDRNGPSFYPLDFGIARYDCKVRHDEPGGEGGALDLRLGRVPKPSGRRNLVRNAAMWSVQYGPRVYRLRAMLRTLKPDVAIGFMPSMFPYLTLAAKATGVPVVASMHNVPDRELGDDPLRWDQNPVDIYLRRKSLQWATATTVLLPSFLDQLAPAVRDKTHVVPNMIQGFGDRRADVATSADNLIVAVGRLAPAKDHETLVRAWALIEDRHPTWRVAIYGDGPLGEALVALRDELGLRRLAFEAPTAEIDSVYATAKLLAMPSRHEGFGLVTVEAMASGLPVVGFADCEGTNEIVLPGENGVLVAPGQDRVRAFAEALSALIDDEALRVQLGSAAPATTKRFDPQTVLDQWEQVILEVAKARS